MSFKDYRISNIRYMLAYALDEKKLFLSNVNNIQSEKFENIYDLFTVILDKTITRLIKKWIFKTYHEVEEPLLFFKWKINISGSLKRNTLLNQKLICIYDEYSENNYLNQIIKTTIFELLKKSQIITKENKNSLYNLKKIYYMFHEIDILNPWEIKRSSIKAIRYNRNNLSYKFVINICYLALNWLLFTEKKGEFDVNDFFFLISLDSLFETFVRNYFKKEFGEYLYSETEKIERQYDKDDGENRMIELLPKMNTDITLTSKQDKKRILIIDTKFYKKILNTKWMHWYDSTSINSEHWFQINSYVSNMSYANKDLNLSWMLLYAHTNEEIIPDVKVNIMWHWMYVRTLDMRKPFNEIENQLKDIADIVLM